MIRYGEREEEEDRLEQELYRKVFLAPEGKKVLSLILADLGLFEPTEPGNERQAALKDYGITLMEHLGCFHEDNIERITGALLSISPYTPTKEAENRGG